MRDEQLIEAGVAPDLIRLSVGIEDVEDIIAATSKPKSQTQRCTRCTRSTARYRSASKACWRSAMSLRLRLGRCGGDATLGLRLWAWCLDVQVL